MLVDSWALNHLKDVGPQDFAPQTSTAPPGQRAGEDRYHPLLDRTGNYYNFYYKKALNSAHEWHKSAKDFVDYQSQMDGSGDHLSSVPVNWKESKERPGIAGGYASGFGDPNVPPKVRPAQYPQPWGPH